ncbi:hypothetical protein C8R46DRAFT_1262022 [Mycena filopes]|nr:hypothetical protein C8R46DRAFT_1262022 [Mycena filopes]
MALDRAQLVGTLLESVMYGTYIMLFIKHGILLRRKATKTWAFAYLLGTSASLFCLITVHIILDMMRVVAAFTDDPATPFAAAHYYGDFDALLSVFRTSVYNALTIISDAFIVYRCFLVWGKSFWISAIPFLLFVADFATAVWYTAALREAHTGYFFTTVAVTSRVKFFYSFTLAVNLLCTLLISYKIWVTDRAVVGRFGDGYLMSRIVPAVVESAAVYSALLIALIVTSVVGSEVMFVILNMISPVIGLVFSAVIVRVSADNYAASTFQSSTLHIPNNERSRRTGRSHGHTDQPNGLEIRLEQITHTHTDAASETETDSDKYAV